jgi:predicted site-specific integrase-resolvase
MSADRPLDHPRTIYCARYCCKSEKANPMKKVGYARVSTRDQNLDGQIAELTAADYTKSERATDRSFSA